jgi:uncharacterized membrane protein (DUF2068 family)
LTTAGERVIATYKTLKGAAQLALGGAVIVVVLTDHVAALHEVAAKLEHHASRAWSIALAHAIAGTVTPHGLNVIALALALDGALTSLEGWALRRGHWWGRWMVVIATGSLMPFELMAFARDGHWTELAALALNVVIVAYLARRAVARHREAKGQVVNALRRR